MTTPIQLPTEKPLRTTPQEWVSRTALTIGRRTGTLTKLDQAYAAYYADQTSMVLAGRLLDQLDAYKKEVGGDWAKSERNKKSGGLFAFTHARIMQEAKRRGWWKAGTGDKGAAKLATYDIPHSRYGVLFLLGNAVVTMDSWKFALEGVSAVGGAVGTGLTTNTARLDSNIAANPTVKLPYLNTSVAESTLVTVGTLPTTIGSKVAASAGERIATKEVGTVAAASTLSYGFPCTRAGIEEIQEDPALFLNPFVLPATLVVGAGTLIADALHNLRVLLVDVVTSLFETIRNKMMADAKWAWDISGTLIKKMIKFIVGKCLAASAPLIGAGMDIGTGIVKTFAAAKERVGAWLLRRKITLNEGHPTPLANAIEADMTKGIFSGLWSLLKGVASLALQSFLPGAGNLVSAIVTGIEWLVKAAWRLWEESKIRKFLAEAAQHFRVEKSLATATPVQGKNTNGLEYQPNMDPKKGGIIHNLEAFKKFYQRGCDASPVIPMITLNSGICGSLWTLLRMFDGREEQMITETVFADGAEYFYRLKEHGRAYLNASGFQFTSMHPSVKRYLAHAISHHQRPKSLGAKILAAAAAQG